MKPWYFERDCPFCTRSASSFCRHTLNCLAHSMWVKWWYHAKFHPFQISFVLFQAFTHIFELNDHEIEKHYKWSLKRLKVGMVSSFHPHSMFQKVERVTTKTWCTSCTKWTITFEVSKFQTIRHESISNELCKSWKLGWYHNFTHIACACTKRTMVACSSVKNLAWYHHNSCGRKSSLFLRLCHLLIAP